MTTWNPARFSFTLTSEGGLEGLVLLTTEMKMRGPQMRRIRPVRSRNPREILTRALCLSPRLLLELYTCMNTNIILYMDTYMYLNVKLQRMQFSKGENKFINCFKWSFGRKKWDNWSVKGFDRINVVIFSKMIEVY